MVLVRTVGLAGLDSDRDRRRLILRLCQEDDPDLPHLLTARQDDQLLDPVARDAKAFEVGWQPLLELRFVDGTHFVQVRQNRLHLSRTREITGICQAVDIAPGRVEVYRSPSNRRDKQ